MIQGWMDKTITALLFSVRAEAEQSCWEQKQFSISHDLTVCKYNAWNMFFQPKMMLAWWYVYVGIFWRVFPAMENLLNPFHIFHTFFNNLNFGAFFIGCGPRLSQITEIVQTKGTILKLHEPDDIFQWYTSSNPIFFIGMQVSTRSYFSVVEVYFWKLKDQPFPVSGSSYVENVFLINRDWPNSLYWTYRRNNCYVS